MSDEEQERKPDFVEAGIKEMKLKTEDSSDEEAYGTIRVAAFEDESVSKDDSSSPMHLDTKSTTQSPRKASSGLRSPTSAKEEYEEVVGGEITVKLEPGQPPKLARSATQKVIARSAPLFHDYPDKTEEATKAFQVITECIYSVKYLGSTEHAMDCDCAEEWGKMNRHLMVLTTFALLLYAEIMYRCYDEDQLCLRGRFGLYQSRHENGVRRRLRVWLRLSESTIPTTAVCQCHSDQNREKGLRFTC